MSKKIALKEFTPFRHRVILSLYINIVVFSTYQWNKTSNEVQDCQFKSIRRDLSLQALEQFRRDHQILKSIRESNYSGNESIELKNREANINKDLQNMEAHQIKAKKISEKIEEICSKIDDASWTLLVISLLAGGVLTALSAFQPQQRELKPKMKRKRVLRNRLEGVKRP